MLIFASQCTERARGKLITTRHGYFFTAATRVSTRNWLHDHIFAHFPFQCTRRVNSRDKNDGDKLTETSMNSEEKQDRQNWPGT